MFLFTLRMSAIFIAGRHGKKILTPEAAEILINKGWKFVGTLPN